MSDQKPEAPKPNIAKGKMKKPPINTVKSQAAAGIAPAHAKALREQPRKTVAESRSAATLPEPGAPMAKPDELGKELVDTIVDYHKNLKLEPSWPNIAASLNRAASTIRFRWSEIRKEILG